MIPAAERAIVESGIILLKYWPEVSPDKKTRRLEARIDDGRKTWKLSDMDLKSYSRCTTIRGPVTRCFSPPTLVGAVVRRPFRQQVAGAAQRPYAHPQKDPLRRAAALKGRAPEAAGPRGDYKETDYPFRVIPERF
jgi:hypothetical protein